MLFPKKSLFFLFIILLLFNFLILSIQSYSYLWYKAFSFFLSPSVKLVHTTTRFFSNLIFSIKEMSKAREENKVLKEKIMWQNIKIGKLTVENLYLKQAYEFDSSPLYFDYITKAYIIKMDIPAYSSRLILSAGRSKGIKENDVCITPDGLAGKIVKVETFNSLLLPIINPDSVVSGITEKEASHGVLKGDGTGFLKLIYLPLYSKISIGEAVFTDCVDLTYPYGIKIGTVEEIEKQTDEMIVKIKPSVDFSKISYVYIIKGARN